MFAFPAASLALAAARSTVTVPSAAGVTVNVYVAPEPERFDVAPLPTDTPAKEKPLTGSEKVAVTMKAALVGFDAPDESVTEGGVAS